jgi:hypothetical protein
MRCPKLSVKLKVVEADGKETGASSVVGCSRSKTVLQPLIMRRSRHEHFKYFPCEDHPG